MSQTNDELFESAQEHHLAGRIAEAIELYHRLLKSQPDDGQTHFFLGLAMFQLGRTSEAVISVRRAIAIDPSVPEYHCDLARFLFHLNDLDGAIEASRKALDLRTDFPAALFNLGNALCRRGLLDDGIDAYQRAIALAGDNPDALNNLGMAFLTLGRIDEALGCFDRILASNPADASAHSNRIYALHFHPSWDATAIRRELLQWNDQHARPLKATIAPHSNDRDLNRPLRIGYISPDFREHVVGWNILPLLREHDRNRFQIFCYSSVRNPDAMTQELRSHVFAWRDIAPISDERAAQMIREDRIDILVDLSLHTGGNRLLIFARKPAPIQVTYLGYPGSTGLEAMDHRFSDPFLDSDEETADYTERTIRLPRTYWCYRPGGATPEVVPPPTASSGIITFGCLNQFQKLSAPVLELWQQIMEAIPSSRLLLHAPLGDCRTQFLKSFKRSGIAADRIEFIARLPWPQYIQTYQRIDIALDTFPHGGGITTCDALWMGVPVVTLRGKTAVGRGATSILGNLNMYQFVAHSPEQYVLIAKALAGNVSQLAEQRLTLRPRMLASALMNADQFTRDIEAAYKNIWIQWVKSAKC